MQHAWLGTKRYIKKKKKKAHKHHAVRSGSTDGALFWKGKGVRGEDRGQGSVREGNKRMISANHSDGSFSLHVGTQVRACSNCKERKEISSEPWKLQVMQKYSLILKNHQTKCVCCRRYQAFPSTGKTAKENRQWRAGLCCCSPPRKLDRNCEKTVEMLNHYKPVNTPPSQEQF